MENYTLNMKKKKPRRKPSDRSKWGLLKETRFSVSQIKTEVFTGYATLLCIDEIYEPFWHNFEGNNVLVADNGFTWIQHFPLDTNYTVTTMFNNHGIPVQWYIDVCKQHGVDESGVPWHEDLYLDVVALPSGNVWILDEDELEDALKYEHISRSEYEFAWREAKDLRKLIQADFRHLPLLKWAEMHWDLLFNNH